MIIYYLLKYKIPKEIQPLDFFFYPGCSVLSCFVDMVSCSSSWPQTHYVVQDDLYS